MKVGLLFILSLVSFCYGETVVIYNSLSEESKKVATHYLSAREIPQEHLIGLPFKEEQIKQIPVDQFNDLIARPLKFELEKRKLCKLNFTGEITARQFDTIVTTYGIPYRTIEAPNENLEGIERLKQTTQASIDSELSLLDQSSYDKKAFIQNPYFKSENPPSKKDPLIVGRIDAPTAELAIKLIDDALWAEENGLHGFCYLDKADKGNGYQLGDQWLESIIKINQKKRIPTIVDRNRDVFVTNYPMENIAFYFGWYTTHPRFCFSNPSLTLERGAIAVHLHSFSAEKLRSPTHNWVGPLVSKGAAVTLGNVHEPFLQFMHHFDIFYDRLSQGWSVGQASLAAMPALSWQTVVIGDPHYRPFKSKQNNQESPFALWKTNKKVPAELKAEFLGLELQHAKKYALSKSQFKIAETKASSIKSKVRNRLHQIENLRRESRKGDAISLINQSLVEYQETPEHKAFLALKLILDPPPPPPVEKQIK